MICNFIERLRVQPWSCVRRGMLGDGFGWSDRESTKNVFTSDQQVYLNDLYDIAWGFNVVDMMFNILFAAHCASTLVV